MFAHLSITKLMALPTAKRNEGKTRSVGVKPCHWACNNGEYVVCPLPGVFTMIMKQTVMPRNTSRASERWVKDIQRFQESEFGIQESEVRSQKEE